MGGSTGPVLAPPAGYYIPFPPSQNPGIGPDVRIPSSWQNHGVSNAQAGPSIPSGYSSSHGAYAAERQRWAQMAYAPPPPTETISLEITAVHEGGPRRKIHGTMIGSICEGKKDIDARIDAPGLIKIALDTVLPKLRLYGGTFIWRPDEFIVRDSKWVDLATHPTNVPYFYNQCLQASRKGTKSQFKPKQFGLIVVVSEKQWNDFETWQDSNDAAESQSSTEITEVRQYCTPNSSHHPSRHPTSTTLPSVATVNSGHINASNVEVRRYHTPTATSHINTSATVVHRRPAPSSHISDTSATGVHPHVPTNPASIALSSSADLAQILVSQGTSSLLHSGIGSATTPNLKRRPHERTVSPNPNPHLLRAITVSPPRKRINAPQTVFSSPDTEQLREGLKVGGGADWDVERVFNQQNENIHFYSIPTPSLETMLSEKNYSFTISAAQSTIGQLTIDGSHANLIGIGAFKTAHPGWLTLTSTSPTATGLEASTSRQYVVVKRPFFYVNTSGKAPSNVPALDDTTKIQKFLSKIGRYSLVDEMQKLFREANVIYWAKCLLKLTYDFIDRSVVAYPAPPPFDIPRVRFVDAGLALSYAPGVTRYSKVGSIHTAFLIEEFIEGGNNNFIKYIHNSSATPLLDPDEEGYELALFFSFAQHVQYVKTGGLAFISDFQGIDRLLTDPQILTHPSVNTMDDTSLFGEGNLEGTVEIFKEQHVCNAYCRWPGFALDEF